MKPSTPWKKSLIALAAIVTVAVGVVEGIVARRQFEASRAAAVEEWRDRLGRSAGHVSRLVAEWAADFVGDAELVAALPSTRQTLAAPRAQAAHGADAARNELGTALEALIQLQHYRSACMLDAAGELLTCEGEVLPADLVHSVHARLAALGRHEIDVYWTPSRAVVVAGVLVQAPGAEKAVGYVLLAADPQDWLYPQLLVQPVPSVSAEYMLVAPEGARSVLIAPTRQVVRPLSTHGFPGSEPAASQRGQGSSAGEIDYRGAPVIAASRAIDGTSWVLVAKIDREEAFAGASKQMWANAAWLVIILVALLALVYGLLRHRQAIYAAEQLRTSEQIGFLNRLLRTITEVNELMVREKNRDRVLAEACRIIVEYTGFRMAWVGEAHPSGQVKPVAWAGAVDGYLDSVEVRWDDTPAGSGPAGTSIRERRTVGIEDIATDPAMAPWRTQALGRGYRSAAGVPLLLDDRVLGTLMVYSAEAAVLRGDALPLLEKLASDLAFALDVIERDERHRVTEKALGERDEQLRQSQKMEAIGRLAGGVAHDFNNLLMAISGYAELALSAKTDEVRRERIEEIAIAADRAAALTRQLLAFSRKQVLQPRVFNPNMVVSDIEKMLRRLIGENIQLETRLAPDMDNVRADPGQLEQVLVNLAVNARDAMPDGGRLVIETANASISSDTAAVRDLEPGNYATVTVTDTGEGMSPEVLEHLFEPFFTTKASGKGTGLGLSMVYGILKQSGGAITVDSAPGSGSTFRVYLPAATTTEEALEAVPQAPLPRPGGESVLVVEDNAAVRGFVNQALRSAGYKVQEADSAERALALLMLGDPAIDLLLTDVVLPKMDGYDLARQVVATRPALRVLYMSGYVENPRLREAALHEHIDLLEKPFTSAALIARVRGALDRAAN